MNDHTPEEIEALTIEIARDGKQLPGISASRKKGSVRKLVKELVVAEGYQDRQHKADIEAMDKAIEKNEPWVRG